ncbi:MAG: tyrosine--tRNA ligase, partial [Dehalococcoidia bacterium]|nr:tyrosine--tRNA ligase [Dehalococcoidia bacterium]
NYIAIDEPPNEIYGKVMSIPDDLMMDYFELLTDVSDEELSQFRKGMESGSVNPMVLKKRLAREIVEQFHDPKAAQDAEAHFEKTVQKREMPLVISSIGIPSAESSGTPTISPLVDIVDILVKENLVKSRAEAKRLLSQGAVQIIHKDKSKHVVSESNVEIKPGDVIKYGKRRFVKIVDADMRR